MKHDSRAYLHDTNHLPGLIENCRNILNSQKDAIENQNE